MRTPPRTMAVVVGVALAAAMGGDASAAPHRARKPHRAAPAAAGASTETTDGNAPSTPADGTPAATGARAAPSSPAAAATRPPAAATRVTGRAMIIPTDLGPGTATRWQADFDAAIATRLRAHGLDVVPTTALTPAELACDAVTCYQPLTAARDVAVVMRARVVSSRKKPVSHVVSLWLYRKGSDHLQFDEQTCAGCAEGKTSELLGEMAGVLLELPAQPASTAPRAELLAGAGGGEGDDSLRAVGEAGARPRHTAPLVVGVAGLAVAAASAALLVVELTRDGQPDCSDSLPAGVRCPYQIDASGGIVIGAVGTGVGVVAAALGFYLWSRRPAPPSARAISRSATPPLWLAPSVGGARGLGLSAVGRF